MQNHLNFLNSKYDLKVCDDGTVVQILCSWTLSIFLPLSKTPSRLFFKILRFGDWILSPSSGKTYSIDSPCYALTEFLHKILSPLTGNAGSFVKNSENFITSIKDINLQNEDYLVSFDLVSLFADVPVEEVLRTAF
jgi:hypothetical protein